MSDERKFLHDISSPIASLQLNLENVMEMLREGKAEEIATCVTILTSSLKQVEKAGAMIQERRLLLQKVGKK